MMETGRKKGRPRSENSVRARCEALSLALEIKVTEEMFLSWQEKGYDLDDPEMLAVQIRNQQRLPAGMASEGEQEYAEVEELIFQLQSAPTYEVARKLKTQIDGLRSAFQLRESIGSYIPAADVDEAFIRIGTVFRAGVMRFEADLPPMLEGLPPEKMQKLIRQKADEVLTILADECRKGCKPD